MNEIDFGQFTTSMTMGQLNQVRDLFAMGQVLRFFGPIDSVVQRIAAVMELNASQRRALPRALSRYFSNDETNIREVTAYFYLLAALEDAGAPPDQVLFDYIRGMVQHNPYEAIVKAHAVARIETEGASNQELSQFSSTQSNLHQEVRQRIRQYLSDFRITPSEFMGLGYRELRLYLQEKDSVLGPLYESSPELFTGVSGFCMEQLMRRRRASRGETSATLH